MTGRGYVSRKATIFEIESLLPFVDLLPLIELVRALPENELSEREQEAKSKFLEAAEKKLAAPTTPADAENEASIDEE